MPETPDVLVLGGGVAGVAAALAAAGAGARVTVVRRGPGATALVAGGWEAPPPAPVRTALAAAGLTLVAREGALPHPDGHLVQCGAAPDEHARAALDNTTGPVLVCGIAGLPAFRPRPLAALWADAAGMPPGGLQAALLELPETPAGGWSPAALAARIQTHPHEMGGALARAAGTHSATRVIVPPVLGLERSEPTLSAVRDAAGVEIGEALGVAPSIPGWRLDRALLRTLDGAGVTVVRGSAAVRETDGQRIRSVTVSGDGGDVIIRAAAFVLATGKFIGGGITAESAYAESVFGCDVAVERFGSPIADPGAALVLTDPARLEPQPLLAIGVRTDTTHAPLLAGGGVAFDNVVVAGTVRYGIETSAGLGSTADDGWNAGERAAALAT
jgi:glycerol-3-phosphate dehydrogenase subunit B